MILRSTATKLVFAALALFPFVSQAQNELDAFRYMQSGPVGTARSMGMAGAFSAVGADFTATTLNPAGLALYRKSDFMLSPTLRTITNRSSYLDENGSELASRLGFSNVGYVYADQVYKWNKQTRYREEATSGLKSYAFSIGFNQLSNFQRNTAVSAYNTQSSISEYFAGLANGSQLSLVEADNGYAGQAWQAYLIDTSGNEQTYVGAAAGGNVQQQIVMNESGRNNEWTIGIAGNVNDKLYLGATLGIQDLKYQTEFSFEEKDINDLHNSWANDSTPFASSAFVNGFRTRGSGFNLRAGLIARPFDFFRFGFSVQSPTWTAMTERYYSNMTAYLDNDPTEKGIEVPDGSYSYNLSTPFKATVGGMILFNKMGFVSADIDYLDYSMARFASDFSQGSTYYYSYRDENKAINSLFTSAMNIRLGAELRFGVIRARAGLANYGAILKKAYRNYFVYPTNEVKTLAGGRQVFSGGVGIKEKSFYIDLAYAHEVSSDRRLVYSLPNVNAYSPELINRISANNFYMTIGFTF